MNEKYSLELHQNLWNLRNIIWNYPESKKNEKVKKAYMNGTPSEGEEKENGAEN